MTFIRLTLSLVLFTISLDLFADFRRYASSIDNSNWHIPTSNRLQCDLVHEIPNYGEAIFSSEAGKVVNLAFELDVRRLPADYSIANIESVPPSWKPGVAPKSITSMQWRKQFNGDVDEKSAWVMLTELEKGFMPTIYYADWHNKNDRVAVALSATRFRDNYYQFLDCMDNLLKYSFDDISYTVLNFEDNSSELDKASKEKLKRIEEYLKHDKDVEAITVNAYSSSWGGRYTNLKVSQKRALQVKEFFIKFGVGAEKILTEGYGEKRHIASNQTEIGRAENRRVVIEMVKP